MRVDGRRPYALVGVGFAAVALVGMVALGWEFGGDTEPIALGLALVAVVLSVVRHATD